MKQVPFTDQLYVQSNSSFEQSDFGGMPKLPEGNNSTNPFMDGFGNGTNPFLVKSPSKPKKSIEVPSNKDKSWNPFADTESPRKPQGASSNIATAPMNPNNPFAEHINTSNDKNPFKVQQTPSSFAHGFNNDKNPFKVDNPSEIINKKPRVQPQKIVVKENVFLKTIL